MTIESELCQVNEEEKKKRREREREELEWQKGK